jgi:type VI secretion system protein ImpK
VLIEAPWKHRGWWKENTLEWEKFKSGECSEQFFIRAKEAHSLPPPRDALEVFYICVVLGFQGLYRDSEAAAALSKPLGLPPDLESWAQQISRAIPPTPRGELREESISIDGAVPLDGPFLLIWSVFITMILAAVAAVLAWGLYGPS